MSPPWGIFTYPHSPHLTCWRGENELSLWTRKRMAGCRTEHPSWASVFPWTPSAYGWPQLPATLQLKMQVLSTFPAFSTGKNLGTEQVSPCHWLELSLGESEEVLRRLLCSSIGWFMSSTMTFWCQPQFQLVLTIGLYLLLSTFLLQRPQIKSGLGRILVTIKKLFYPMPTVPGPSQQLYIHVNIESQKL